MAYNKSASAPSRNNAPQANDGFTKASAFLNIGINGKKLVGVPLYEHQDEHAQLMEWLSPTGATPEETEQLRRAKLETLVNALTVTYVPVSKEPKKFDLPS